MQSPIFSAFCGSPLPPPAGVAQTHEFRQAITSKTGIVPKEMEPQRGGECILLYGMEGWGKTTAGAYADDPIIVSTHNERGYQSLLRYKRVPACDSAPVTGYEELIGVIQAVGAAKAADGRSPKYKTFVLDALTGVESMITRYVADEEFHGDMGESGFLSYHKGYTLSIQWWDKLLSELTSLSLLGMRCLILSHARPTTIQNPAGKDYDRFMPDLHRTAVPIVNRWAHAILFGAFVTVVNKDGKGSGGRDRILQCVGSDVAMAKNQFGMPDVIAIPNDPTKTWASIAKHLNPI